MKKIFILFLYFSICISMFGGIQKELEWEPYGLLKKSSNVILADVSFDYMMRTNERNFIVANDVSVLFGPEEKKNRIYIVSNPPTTGMQSPPAFLPGKYLLFINPIGDDEWNYISNGRSMLPRENFFQVVGSWKGAICMNESFRDSANRAIYRKYKIDDPNLVLDAVLKMISFVKEGEIKTEGNLIVDEFIREFNQSPFGKK